MGRITYLLSIMVLLIGISSPRVVAQPVQSTQVDFDKFQKKIVKSDKEIADPKKSLKGKTWMKRGDIFVDLSRTYLMNTYAGMDVQTFFLLSGQPTSQEQTELNGTPYYLFHMPRVDVYFNAQKIFAFLKVIDPLVQNPLGKAREAFEKAAELDVKGKRTKKIAEHLVMVHDMMANEGINHYLAGDYKDAAFMLDQAVDLGKTDMLKLVDTVVYYSAGIVHLRLENYAKAADYFKMALDNGYDVDGKLYCSYYEVAKKSGRIEEAKTLVESVVEKYPEEKCLMLSLIDYYVSQDKDPKIVLPYIDNAIAASPDLPVLYFIKGVVQEKLENPDAAMKAYKKATEVDPSFADAYYNMAIMNYNMGVQLQNEGLNLPRERQNEYDDFVKRSSEAYRSAIPLAEKALEVQADHQAAKDLLKTLYFRFRAEPDMQQKYDAIVGK